MGERDLVDPWCKIQNQLMKYGEAFASWSEVKFGGWQR